MAPPPASTWPSSDRPITLCVVGLGYIGLPTAAMFATHGFQVIGVDTNPRVVETLSAGALHIREPGLETLVQAAVKSGNLRVTTQPAPADAFIIAVPTPLRHDTPRHASDGLNGHAAPGPAPDRRASRAGADLSNVIAAGESIVPHLRPGSLVVLESTVPPRTTLDVLVPILARSGLPLSTTEDGRSTDGELHVAHCPERVLPGRILEELVGNARVIGGVSQHAAELAHDLYARFVQGEIILTDATTAELVKLAENTFRDVNIALANELALVAEQVGVDVWETIDLANHHPRVNILKPGPGVGGHCIAVDPWFIAQAAPDVTPLIQTARGVNDARPSRVVELVRQAAGTVARPTVACLGLTYKADVDDIRESPSIEVVSLLQRAGCVVRAYDPLVPLGTIDGQVPSLRAAIEAADVVVLLTDHSEFRQLAPDILTLLENRAVVDTRRALPASVRVRPRHPTMRA